LLIDWPLSTLARRFTSSVSNYAVRHCPGAMAAASRSDVTDLLVFQCRPSFALLLLRLDDDEIRPVSRIPIDRFVHDMCWCEQRQLFVLVTDESLYEFSGQTRRLCGPFAHRTATSGTLSTLTCSAAHLYVVHKSPTMICQRDVNAPFDERRRWTHDEVMREPGDRAIGSIRLDREQQIGR
jgi:hypothetical protein